MTGTCPAVEGLLPGCHQQTVTLFMDGHELAFVVIARVAGARPEFGVFRGHSKAGTLPA
jgi:hypothetical protein